MTEIAMSEIPFPILVLAIFFLGSFLGAYEAPPEWFVVPYRRVAARLVGAVGSLSPQIAAVLMTEIDMSLIQTIKRFLSRSLSSVDKASLQTSLSILEVMRSLRAMTLESLSSFGTRVLMRMTPEDYRYMFLEHVRVRQKKYGSKSLACAHTIWEFKSLMLASIWSGLTKMFRKMLVE